MYDSRLVSVIDALHRVGLSCLKVAGHLRLNSTNEPGQKPASLSRAEAGLFNAAQRAAETNPWFTVDFITMALEGINVMLHPLALQSWLSDYRQGSSGKKIRVIMAGNLPLVGFHDMLCVLISGHRLLARCSSQDAYLPPSMGRLMAEHYPPWEDQIHFDTGDTADFDAVIATGSNNTARYFEHYFRNLPSIIRQNRHSLAIIDPDISESELSALGQDVFAYFGRGCRSVSQIWLPPEFPLLRLQDAWKQYESWLRHEKYLNNLLYHKAIMMVNRETFTDNGFSLFKESNELSGPLSVIHLVRYSTEEQCLSFIKQHVNEIQCVVASEKWSARLRAAGKHLDPQAFGQAQRPGPGQYADGIDTLAWLASL